MGRLVKNITTPLVEAIFTFEYTDGSKKKSIVREDDIVYVSYIENKELKELRGRINRILFERIYTYSSSKKIPQKFSSHYKITGIELDYSETNYSKIVKINSSTIVEIHDAGAELDAEKANKQTVIGNLVVDVSTELSDGTVSSRTITIGDAVSGLNYTISSQDRTITGTVTNITYRIAGASSNSKSSTLKLTDTLVPEMMYVMMVNGDVRMVPIRQIKDVGHQQTTITSIESISEVLANVEDGDIVKLPSGEITTPIELSKSITLCGANAGISAASGDRCNENLDGETVISSLNVSEGVSVSFDGLAFTGDAYIQLKGSEDVNINNCKMVGVTPYTKKSHAIHLASSSPATIHITNCYFGSNPSTESMDMYHIFELYGFLTNNSTISNNYFAKGCCRHNIISIYGIEDGARIFISGNVFEYSGNAIRLGMKGAPDCTVMIEKNTYYETDSNEDYAGLFCIQPYGLLTETFEKCVIMCNNTKRKDSGRLFYLWYGTNDTQITSSKKPTVYVNTSRVMYPTSEKKMDLVD